MSFQQYDKPCISDLNWSYFSVIYHSVTVLSIDYINKRNFTGRSIPKFDNIVKSPMFDEDTNIMLPKSLLTEAPYQG